MRPDCSVIKLEHYVCTTSQIVTISNNNNNNNTNYNLAQTGPTA